MSKQTEALRLALEALEWFTAAEPGDEPPINAAITAIREALASGANEQPASKPWVGLTDEEMLEVVHYSQLDNARAIEAKLKEKNT